jgi:hypothetical protein
MELDALLTGLSTVRAECVHVPATCYAELREEKGKAPIICFFDLPRDGVMKISRKTIAVICGKCWVSQFGNSQICP